MFVVIQKKKNMYYICYVCLKKILLCCWYHWKILLCCWYHWKR